MAKSYLEKRIIRAGTELCKSRIERKGTTITADDLKNLRVRSMAPGLLALYTIIGVGFMAFGIWVHIASRNMAYSFIPVIVGFANVGIAVHGRPRRVADLGDSVDLMSLSTEIVKRFVGEMDAKRGSGPSA